MPKGTMSFLILIAIVLAIIYMVFQTPIGTMLGVINTPSLKTKQERGSADAEPSQTLL